MRRNRLVIGILSVFIALSVFTFVKARGSYYKKSDFYDFHEIQAVTDEKILGFVSRDGSTYQIRDLESFKLLYQIESPDSKASGKIINDKILLYHPRESDVPEDHKKYTLIDFEGNRTSYILKEKLHQIVWEDEPIFISSTSQLYKEGDNIFATQNGEVVWSKRGRPFGPILPGAPMWMWLDDTENMQLVNPKNGEIMAEILGQYMPVLHNKNISILRESNNAGKHIIFSVANLETVYEFDYRRAEDVFLLDDESAWIFTHQKNEDKKRIYSLKIINSDGEFTFDDVFEISDMKGSNSSFVVSPSNISLQASDVSGNLLIYPNHERSRYEVIDARTKAVVWESDLADIPFRPYFINDEYLFLSSQNYFTLVDAATKRLIYRVKRPQLTEKETSEVDGLRYKTYRFPTADADYKNYVVKVEDIKTSQLEPYEYEIPNIYHEDYVIPTKHGVVHIPKYILGSRLSFFKPGISSAFYVTDEIHPIDGAVVHHIEFTEDKKYLKMTCSNHSKNFPEKDERVYIYFDPNTLEVFSDLDSE